MLAFGTVLVLLGLLLAVLELFVSNRYLLPVAVILVAAGVLVGAPAVVGST